MSIEAPEVGRAYRITAPDGEVVETLNCVRVKGRRLGFAPFPFSCIETQSTRLRWTKAVAHMQAQGFTIEEVAP